MRIGKIQRGIDFQPRKGIIMGERMGSNNDLATKLVQELTAERDRLREEVNRLHAEAAELRRALEKAQQEVRDKAAIVAERDLYLRELEAFWAEKIADMDKNGVDFGEFITELERDLEARGTLDGK
jgi:predicted RNase H-like nuclease (RuvC/YqgF family)